MADEKKENKPYFDEEKKKKAEEWVKAKVKNHSCDCCGNTEWILSPHIVVPPAFEGMIMLGGEITPLFMVVCKNCGNTRAFNAVIMGLVPPKTKEKKEGGNGK